MSTLLKTVLLVFWEIVRFFFPLSEDEQIIEETTQGQFLQKLSVQKNESVVTLSSIKDAEVRAVVHLVKFHHNQRAVTLAGALLRAWLEAHVDTPAVIVPIPLSKKRHRERGFNQAESIARQACKNLPGFSVRTDILVRKKHTIPQTDLKKKERLENVAGAFAITDKNIQVPEQVILFDDVMTTGATLRAGEATLRPHAAQITCVALAH